MKNKILASTIFFIFLVNILPAQATMHMCTGTVCCDGDMITHIPDGRTKTVPVKENEYEIINTRTTEGPGELKINGEKLKALNDGDIRKIKDGSTIEILDVSDEIISLCLTLGEERVQSEQASIIEKILAFFKTMFS
ncbi:hypothetical protein KY338_02415 [Candidatus Woesearchaeota archaeon]|nr:hypothetical protein [Candidatus Woesearchaeota archaeon]MBW3005930.1 hypothetical protein [Candidatus Woesearchaeota archaeon]